MLFFDPRLSASDLISCNTCHNVGLGGADLQAHRSMGVGLTQAVPGPVDLPDGLFGTHSRPFIVPEGGSAPGGSPERNPFHYMSTGQCLLGSRPCPE